MTDPLMPPANGTDQRLDLVLDELRALRAELTAPAAERAEPADGDQIELREPAAAPDAKPAPPQRRR